MLRKYLQVWLFIFGAAGLFLPSAGIGQTAANQTGSRQEAGAILESGKEYAAATYSSYNRRDPFLNPLLLMKNEDADGEAPRGNPPPGIAGMYIDQVELVGVSGSPEGILAVFRGTDRHVYFLHEGDRMFDGYIKSVALDAVQLIRETKMRSGKLLTEQVTKRLRTP